MKISNSLILAIYLITLAPSCKKGSVFNSKLVIGSWNRTDVKGSPELPNPIYSFSDNSNLDILSCDILPDSKESLNYEFEESNSLLKFGGNEYSILILNDQVMTIRTGIIRMQFERIN